MIYRTVSGNNPPNDNGDRHIVYRGFPDVAWYSLDDEIWHNDYGATYKKEEVEYLEPLPPLEDIEKEMNAYFEKKFKQGGYSTFEAQEFLLPYLQQAREEVRELREEVERLKKENELLKPKA